MASITEGKDLHSLIERILKYRAKIREKETNPYKRLSSSFGPLSGADRLMKKIEECDLFLIPSDCCDQIQKELKKYECILKQIIQSGEKEGYENLALIIKNKSENIGEWLDKFLHYLGTVPLFLEHDTIKKLQKCLDKAKQYEAEIKEILEACRPKSAKIGVLKSIDNYSEAGNRHADKGWWWFWGCVALLIGLCVYVSCIIYTFKDTKTDPVVWGYSEIGHIVLLIVLGYAIIFCVKNYHAEKHNEIINKHKARSLDTYPALSGGTADEVAKAQILVQACASIFANSATGFNKGQEMPLPSPTIEVARQVTSRITDKKDPQ